MKKKMIVELEWDCDKLSEGWTNLDNLKTCLYGKEHTCEDLVDIRVLPVCEDCEPEKPKREIDGDEYQGWYVDSAGWAVRSDGEALDSDDEEIKAKIEQLIATSPDAIRAMIDFVNKFNRYTGVTSDTKEWIAIFSKIITDAGFGSDIA